jgi:hypothetical protein
MNLPREKLILTFNTRRRLYKYKSKLEYDNYNDRNRVYQYVDVVSEYK